MDAYDEPFDEFMGPSNAAKKRMLEARSQIAPASELQPASTSEMLPAVVSPEPSPVASSRGSSGPPSSAFSGHGIDNSSSGRWAQYEQDGARLRQESELATGRAVYSAAERVASRASTVDERMNSAGSSLPHPDELRSHKTSTSGGFSFSSTRRSQRPPEEDQSVYQTHERVRAEALKVLEMADDVVSPIRKTSSGGYTTEVEQAKRLPARMAGISFSNNRSSQSSRASESERRYTIDDVDSDEDMVDVVNMQSAVGRSSNHDDSSQKSSWSSRYSVSQSLLDLSTGGYKDSKAILDSMDLQERQRMDKSARNMFRTSPHKSIQSPKIFGSGFASAAKSVFGRKETVDHQNVNLKTAWMDVDLQSNGRSLPLPPVIRKHRGPVTLEQARKRRRICVCVILTIILIVIIASVAGTQANKGTAASSALDDPNAVKFYVTADVPYDASQEDKIIQDIETIPGDADFVIHLGNIQDAFVTLCPQQAYISARAILRRCAAPVFMLPGPNDWTNCPKPESAMKDWTFFLGYFERNFVHSFGVTHQLGNEENFGFLDKGVLFIGIHLVGGRRHDKEEWRIRHAKNVRWIEEQLAQVPRDKYRALVLLANARPSQMHDDFFSEIMDDVNALGKPVLYIHANAGSNLFEQYIPFPNAPNLIAVQIPSGGSNPPVKVAVGEGQKPFAFDS
jgi:hypothetical protein